MHIVKASKHRRSLSVMIHQLESLNLYDVTDHYSLIAFSKTTATIDIIWPKKHQSHFRFLLCKRHHVIDTTI